jgi:hypothetical protein
MLGWIAALVLAPTQIAATPPLAASDWWEKITVTLSGDGKPQACQYETSGRSHSSADCQVVGSNAKGFGSKSSIGAQDQFTRITFERRFSPGVTAPSAGSMHPGDTLLGREVLKLAIDAGGKVSGCRVVATSGEMTPDYGCAEASSERFEANARQSEPAAREGFMTIMIYGHAENLT